MDLTAWAPMPALTARAFRRRATFQNSGVLYSARMTSVYVNTLYVAHMERRDECRSVGRGRGAVIVPGAGAGPPPRHTRRVTHRIVVSAARVIAGSPS